VAVGLGDRRIDVRWRIFDIEVNVVIVGNTSAAIPPRLYLSFFLSQASIFCP
jgi:hypothetical protein